MFASLLLSSWGIPSRDSTGFPISCSRFSSPFIFPQVMNGCHEVGAIRRIEVYHLTCFSPPVFFLDFIAYQIGKNRSKNNTHGQESNQLRIGSVWLVTNRPEFRARRRCRLSVIRRALRTDRLQWSRVIWQTEQPCGSLARLYWVEGVVLPFYMR